MRQRQARGLHLFHKRRQNALILRHKHNVQALFEETRIGRCRHPFLQIWQATKPPRQVVEPPTEPEEKSSGSGDKFLQNIARLMDGYGVSSIDELIKTVDEGGADPKKKR